MGEDARTDDSSTWKARYRAPIVYWTQGATEAPDRGLAVSNQSGVIQLYAWEVGSGALRRLTDRPAGVVAGTLAPDGRYVYYLDDQQGNEIGHFVRVPWAGGPPEDLTPSLPPYASWGIQTSGSGTRLGFIAGNAQGFQTYVLNQGANGPPETPRLLHETTSLSVELQFSHDGALLVVQTTERSGTLDFNLLAFDTETGAQVAELWDGPETSMKLYSFAPRAGDDRVLATTNRSGVDRPLVWNPRTGERTELVLDHLDGEIEPWSWSPDGRHVLLCQFTQAVQQLYMYDLTDHTCRRLDHPPGSFTAFSGRGTYITARGEIFAQWQDAAHPSQVIALDAATGRPLRTVLVAGDVPPSRPWRSVTFPSTDGTHIQGWLGLPEGAGPFPTVLHTHGGPTAVMTESFAPGGQSWLDHGFAFLTINYRGSTTFGRAFEKQIWGDVGHWETEDMAAAHAWLVQEGIARPDAILLTGGSYGGYLTLMGLGKHPDLWAGGMGVVAIADWVGLYEDSAPTLRGYAVGLLGGTPEQNPAQYAASSPVTYAAQVQAPLLVIQGRNDTRCPARQMEEYEEKMRALGKPIEVVWFDAGHGSLDVEQAIAQQEQMLHFAERILQAGAWPSAPSAGR
jgi:dipeptidyl aminopeptidase/acylaminoacyl peptidase